MDGMRVDEKGIEETQRYVKLTRALILKRILADSDELGQDHRHSMEEKLRHLMVQLEMNELEFEKALNDLQRKNDLEQRVEEKNASDEDPSKKEATAFCLSRQCRHQFTVAVNGHAIKRCPQCGGPIIFSV